MLKKALPLSLVIGLLVLALPLAAAAQALPLAAAAQWEDPPSSTPYSGRGFGMMGRGSRGARGWMGGGMSLVAATAEATGLTVDDVVAALQAGETYADLAESAGVTLEAIVDAAVAARTAALTEAVESGRLTQEQADAMLAEMEEHLREQLDGTWTPYGGGYGYDGDRPFSGRAFSGRGRMRGRIGGRGGMHGSYGTPRGTQDPATCPFYTQPDA